MKHLKKYILMAILGYLVAVLAVGGRLHKVRAERDTAQRNTSALMDEVERYRIKDSAQVARAGVLELRLSDYKRMRAEDAEMIKSLRTQNRRLNDVTKIQASTIINLRGTMRDSVVHTVERTDTLRCIDVEDRWFELHGCTDGTGEFFGRLETWDSLTIIETTRYKRFLGFLWRTKRIKDRKIDVVNKNPHTIIGGIERISIIN